MELKAASSSQMPLSQLRCPFAFRSIHRHLQQDNKHYRLLDRQRPPNGNKHYRPHRRALANTKKHYRLHVLAQITMPLHINTEQLHASKSRELTSVFIMLCVVKSPTSPNEEIRPNISSIARKLGPGAYLAVISTPVPLRHGLCGV